MLCGRELKVLFLQNLYFLLYGELSLDLGMYNVYWRLLQCYVFLLCKGLISSHCINDIMRLEIEGKYTLTLSTPALWCLTYLLNCFQSWDSCRRDCSISPLLSLAGTIWLGLSCHSFSTHHTSLLFCITRTLRHSSWLGGLLLLT